MCGCMEKHRGGVEDEFIVISMHRIRNPLVDGGRRAHPSNFITVIMSIPFFNIMREAR